MTKFETGRTYFSRSVGDADCLVTVTVLRRTAKTVWTEALGRVKALRVKVVEGVEVVEPWGRYSMSPVVKADRPLGE